MVIFFHSNFFHFSFFDIPNGLILPEIRSCSEVYGHIVDGPLAETSISGVMDYYYNYYCRSL